jgi:para-nitrobenzyl esterase
MAIQDPVGTTGGFVAGSSIGDPHRPVRIYRGIPYAASTAGSNRWRPPSPPLPWNDIRECTVMPPNAPQAIGKLQVALHIPQSENCLTLNVLTPAETPGECFR